MSHREPFDVTGKTAAATQTHSPWHSPVPYLFGGLAAMLSLIAFALLILACSYWKLSGLLEVNGESEERDLEAGEGDKGNENRKAPPVYEDKVLVIMAGQQKPTFIATPTISSRSSSFNDDRQSSCSNSVYNSETDEKPVQTSGDRLTTGRLINSSEPGDQTY